MGQSQEIVSNAFISSSMISCDVSEYINIFEKIYHELLDNKLEYLPGMPNFINVLVSRGYPLGLVSSSSLATIKKISQVLNFDNLFTFTISSDDVKKQRNRLPNHIYLL